MHIPDGFLSPPVWATLDVTSAAGVTWVARAAKKQSQDESKLPLLGVMGAFVFTAQMVNFPIGMGTSAHLVGGALLSIILGPGAASLVMTAIIALQALIFQDGGVLAMGANVFNMALVGVFAGYLPYRILGKRPIGIFLSGFSSVVVSGCLALGQLLISGVKIPGKMLWVSVALFTGSALVEGAITVATVRGIERLNPAWVPQRAASPRAMATIAVVSALLVATGIFAASVAPDVIQKLTVYAAR